jgi:hypothetical protein
MLLIQLNVYYFICLCRMMMKFYEDHIILSIAYLDPMMVTEALVKKKPEEMEDYIVNFFLKHQNKAIYISTLQL